MIDTHWGNEGNFGWRRLPYAGYRIDGRYRRDRHRHPFFVLRNHRSGEHWIGNMGWSAGMHSSSTLTTVISAAPRASAFALGLTGRRRCACWRPARR